MNLYVMVANDAVNKMDLVGLATIDTGSGPESTLDNEQKQCWKRVIMTHYGNLKSDRVGTRDNPLKPGDIAVGHHGTGQHPKKNDKWSLPFGTPVSVYPDNSPPFEGNVADVGAFDKKHPNKAGPEDWIDIWDPEKSRRQITDEGYISISVPKKCPCPSGYTESSPILDVPPLSL